VQKELKQELNTLEVADFVRDGDNPVTNIHRDGRKSRTKSNKVEPRVIIRATLGVRVSSTGNEKDPVHFFVAIERAD